MAFSTREDLNYLGQLYQIGATQTPLLTMIGGLSGGGKTAASFEFPIAQPWSLDDASQKATSEALAAVAGTPKTYTRAQETNTIQIMKYDYASTFAKQSTAGEIAGLSIIGEQPVQDEFAFQKAAAMKQMAVDVDFSFMQGAYVKAVNSATIGCTRGLKNAITTNVVTNGTAAPITEAMIIAVMRMMASNGAKFENMVLFAGAFQKTALTAIYKGQIPLDRNIGGMAIKTIVTDFAELGIVWSPNMAADQISIIDVASCFPVFVPVKGAVISDITVAQAGAQEGGFLYSQVGLDYGPQEYHGIIKGLTTA